MAGGGGLRPSVEGVARSGDRATTEFKGSGPVRRPGHNRVQGEWPGREQGHNERGPPRDEMTIHGPRFTIHDSTKLTAWTHCVEYVFLLGEFDANGSRHTESGRLDRGAALYRQLPRPLRCHQLGSSMEENDALRPSCKMRFHGHGRDPAGSRSWGRQSDRSGHGRAGLVPRKVRGRALPTTPLFHRRAGTTRWPPVKTSIRQAGDGPSPWRGSLRCLAADRSLPVPGEPDVDLGRVGRVTPSTLICLPTWQRAASCRSFQHWPGMPTADS